MIKKPENIFLGLFSDEGVKTAYESGIAQTQLDVCVNHYEPLIKEMYEALKEAGLQIEYLHEKFQETGTGNNVLTRISGVLAKVEGK